MPPRQCDTMSSAGRSRQKQNGGMAANRACVGVKLCCSFEISPRLAHSERKRQTQRKRERWHLWIRAVSTVTFVTADCQLCSLSEWLTTHFQARSSTAFIIITLPLFGLLDGSIKHVYVTVWQCLVLIEVSSPFQTKWALLRGRALGTSTWFGGTVECPQKLTNLRTDTNTDKILNLCWQEKFVQKPCGERKHNPKVQNTTCNEVQSNEAMGHYYF